MSVTGKVANTIFNWWSIWIFSFRIKHLEEGHETYMPGKGNIANNIFFLFSYEHYTV